MFRHLFCLLLLCALSPALSALDLMKIDKWTAGRDVKITPFRERSGEPVVRIEIPGRKRKSPMRRSPACFRKGWIFPISGNWK